MDQATVFAKGEVFDNPDGVNMSRTGKLLKWVAVRGLIHDWTIYIDNSYTPVNTYAGVRRCGNKITSEENIKKLVPCDAEAFGMYRY